MTSLAIPTPFPLFTDIDGQPLENGYIFIGATNNDPEASPIFAYWDAALTQLATQPIVTRCGYPVNNGSIGKIYVNSDFSIKIKNKNGTVIHSAPTSTERFSTLINAVDVSYVPIGGVSTNVASKFGEFVSVKDFGAFGDGIHNDSLAIYSALATNKQVYIPAGTYLCNVDIPNRCIIYGDGSTLTIIKPFSLTKAAFTYTKVDVLWSFHSEIRGIGFEGLGTKTGVGFTFGKTNPVDYVVNDELTRNVKFYSCYFKNLEKGVQFPFGNIGTEFYSCGFSSNKYGVYTIDNKFAPSSTNMMHAGNKYFYAGEFSANDCAFYCNNATEGFGAIKFDGTIFEYNKIGFYIYNINQTFVPISFNGVWCEGNGTLQGGIGTVDVWTGTALSTKTVTNRSIIVEGDLNTVIFTNGTFTDCACTATRSTITVKSCRVEESAGFSGGKITCAVSSHVVLSDCFGMSFTGGSNVNSITAIAKPLDTLNSSSTQSSAAPVVCREFSVVHETNFSLIKSLAGVSGTYTYSGTSGGSFSTSVASGSLPLSRQATFAFPTGSEFYAIDATTTTLSTVGYYFVSINVVLGNANSCNVAFWNRGTKQFFNTKVTDKWTTVYAIRYVDAPSTLFIDFSRDDANSSAPLWNGFQLHRFDSYDDALKFADRQQTYISPDYIKNVLSAPAGVAISVIDFANFKTGTYSFYSNLSSFRTSGYDDSGIVQWMDGPNFNKLSIGGTNRIAISGTTLTYTQSSGAPQNIEFRLRPIEPNLFIS